MVSVTGAIVLVGILAVALLGTAAIWSWIEEASERRELAWRTYQAHRQIREIGERTRAAIRAEAARRKQQGL